MDDDQATKKCPSCQEKISVDTTKCPYCSKDFRNWFIRHPIISIIIAIFVLPSFLSGLFSGISSPTKKSSSSPKESVQISKTTQNKNTEINKKELEEERQRKVDNLTNEFCKKRQGKYIYDVFFCNGCVNLNEILDNSDLIHNAKSPATFENCQKVVDICLEKWSEEECQKIAEQKIWLGMSGLQLYLSWGVPKNQNNTIGSWGFNSQWVYSSDEYVYLEGKTREEAVVTSWQN